MIRTATLHDAPAMVALGRQFLAVSGAGLPFDADWCLQRAQAAILHLDMLALVLEVEREVVGMFVAQCQPHMFSPAKVAQEVVWFVAEAHRGAGLRFLPAYEAWAAGKAATAIGLATLDDRTGAVFARRGYRQIETHWMRAV